LPMFGANTVGLKWDHLNPIRGLSKLKSKISAMEWAKILILVSVAAAALWRTVSMFWHRIAMLPAYDIHGSNALLRSMVVRLASYIVGIALVTAIADFFLQRRRFEKSLMQTKAEVKEDFKATEGSPAVRSKIRSIQREQARKRMMARIKDADVIV